MYKYYIRINENNEIIKAFCNAFEDPLTTDILYKDNQVERCLYFPLCNEDGSWKYEWKNNEIVEIDLIKIKKTKKKKEIDIKTSQLILQGFEYNNYYISTSLEAQTNWNSLLINIDNITFPCVIPALKDNKEDEITFADKADLLSCYQKGFSKKNGYINSGKDLKKQIELCTTQKQLDTIIDDRT